MQDKAQPIKPRKGPQKPADRVAVAPWDSPSVDEAQARYEAILGELQAQAAQDVRAMLERVAQRVLEDLQDDEDAAEMLLMTA